MSAYECPLCNGAPLAERDALRARVAELEAQVAERSAGLAAVAHQLDASRAEATELESQLAAAQGREAEAARHVESLLDVVKTHLTGMAFQEVYDARAWLASRGGGR